MTPQEFYNKYKGQCIDYDKAYGYQCVDGMRVFMQWCNDNGVPIPNVITPNNTADGYWYYRDKIGFYKTCDYITNYKDLQNGDWCMWAVGSKSHSLSHIAMYYNGKQFGERQGGNNGFCLKDCDFSDILGAFRLKIWNTGEQPMADIKTGYSLINYNGIRLHCYKMNPDTEEIKLYSLKHPSLGKLSQNFCSGITMNAKKNASFFVMSTGEVNGSEVSDIYDEAVPTTQNYIDVVQLKDGSWKFGNFGYDVYRKDTANLRYSTGMCLIAGGKYSEEYSEGCGQSIQTDAKTLSLLGIDWSNNPIFIVMEPSQTATPYTLRQWGLAYNLQYLFRDDGGGSAELCVGNEIKNKVASERALPNWLAIIAKNADPVTPDKQTDNTTADTTDKDKEIKELTDQVNELLAEVAELNASIKDLNNKILNAEKALKGE